MSAVRSWVGRGNSLGVSPGPDLGGGRIGWDPGTDRIWRTGKGVCDVDDVVDTLWASLSGVDGAGDWGLHGVPGQCRCGHESWDRVVGVAVARRDKNPTVMNDFDLRQVWPTYKKVLDDPRLNAEVPWFNNQKVGQYIREGADAMLPFYQGVWWPEVNAALNPKLKEVYQGKLSPKQALDSAQEEAKAAITQKGGKVD